MSVDDGGNDERRTQRVDLAVQLSMIVKTRGISEFGTSVAHLCIAHSGVGRIGRLLGVPFRSKRSRAAPYLSYTYDPHRRTSCPLHDQSSSTFVFFCSLGLPQIFFRLFSRSGCADMQMGIGRT